MALIKCPECGREISDKLSACIHCGYPSSRDEAQLDIVKSNTTEVGDSNVPQDDIAVEKVHRPLMEKEQKTKLVFIVLAVVLIMGMIWGLESYHDKNVARQRDLSDVFDFSFDMTIEDVIAYEAEKYGNIEHERENLSDKTRLDFEKYGYDDWKHRYFFDKKTGLLINVYYSGVIITFGDKDEAECEHVRPLKKALLNEIGEWDEKPVGDSVRSIAYGQIDGVPCKILYFDGATQELYISNDDNN